jgi:hypothetical protein
MVRPDTQVRMLELLSSLRAPEQFAELSLRQVKEALRMPLAELLMTLAQIEASYWTDEDAAEFFKPRRPDGQALGGEPVSVTEDWRMKVKIALRSEWLGQLDPHDLRFEYSGKAPLAKWVAEEIEKPVLTSRTVALCDALVAADKCSWVEELESVVEHAFEHAHRGPGAAASRERWKSIFLRRFAGQRVLTLQEVGEAFGVTRERVRQICDGILEGIQERPAMMPALDKLLAASSRMGPVYFGDADEQLTRLLGEGAGLAAALEFAQAIGRQSPTTTVSARVRTANRYQEVSLVQASGLETRWIQRAIQFASRECRVIGCSNFLRVAGLLSFEEEWAVDRDTLTTVFRGLPGFRLVDEAGGWFTLPGAEESVVATRLRKLLCVASDGVGIDDLLGTMVTDARLSQDFPEGMSVPPLHVVSSLLKGWPWLEGDGHNNFRAAEPIERTRVLAEVELLCLKVMESFQEVATRADLAQCVVDEHGFSSPALSFVLSDSPIFAKVEHSVYRINGRVLNVEGLIAARQRRALQRSKLQPEHVIDASQPIAVEMKQPTSQAPLSKWVVYLPSVYSSVINGIFHHADGTGPAIRIGRYGQIARIAKFALSKGVESGETFQVVFNVPERTYELAQIARSGDDCSGGKESIDDGAL